MNKKISNNKSLFSLLKITWFFLSKRRRKQVKFLALIIFFNSFAEIISIASLLPYLAVLINPESLLKYNIAIYLGDLLGLESPKEFILPFTLIFLAATLFSGVIRLFFNYYTLKISSSMGSDLSIKAFDYTLNRKYSYHVERNSNILLTTISKDINEIIYYIFNPIFHLISSIFISISIVLTLLFINFEITISSFFMICIFYLAFVKLTSKTIKNLSTRNLTYSQNLTKLVQESIGAIRDIILSNNQKYYLRKYEFNDKTYREDVSLGNFLNLAPRLFLEPIGIIIVASFGYYLVSIGNIKEAIPIMGALSFSAIRLLPFAQRVYEGITLPRLAKSRLLNLLRILENPPSANKSNNSPLLLKKKIDLNNITFKYSDKSLPIIKDLSLTIYKGEKIGIIGKTGSGKSTLVDLIMGLVEPTKGYLYIDQVNLFKDSSGNLIKSWQESLMHVPQNVFLTDASISENIALGVNQKYIDQERVFQVAKQAHLMDLIEKSKDGFDTFVGERGIRLSGGQKQRIAIARALYKGSKTILLDEATSALDNKTEELIVKNLNHLGSDVTIIIIAHRLNTLRFCDKVFELKNGILNLVELKY